MKVEFDKKNEEGLTPAKLAAGQCFVWKGDDDGLVFMMVCHPTRWTIRNTTTVNREVIEKDQVLVVRLDTGLLMNVSANYPAVRVDVTAKVSEYVPAPVPAAAPAPDDEGQEF